jgi:hypothetical protein
MKNQGKILEKEFQPKAIAVWPEKAGRVKKPTPKLKIM